jgi:hypothetical protein
MQANLQSPISNLDLRFPIRLEIHINVTISVCSGSVVTSRPVAVARQLISLRMPRPRLRWAAVEVARRQVDARLDGEQHARHQAAAILRLRLSMLTPL